MSTVMSIVEILAAMAAAVLAARWEGRRRNRFAAEAARGLEPSGRPITFRRWLGMALLAVVAATILPMLPWRVVAVVMLVAALCLAYRARRHGMLDRAPAWLAGMARGVSDLLGDSGIELCAEESVDAAAIGAAVRAIVACDRPETPNVETRADVMRSWLVLHT